MNEVLPILHPALALKISAAITSRSVAQSMVDVILHAKPHNHEAFLYWVAAHREASATLGAMGIDVTTFDEPRVTS